MNLAEKLAQTPKLERIDSSIESCIKILEQELVKRADEAPGWSGYTLQLLEGVQLLKEDFNVMKGKK